MYSCFIQVCIVNIITCIRVQFLSTIEIFVIYTEYLYSYISMYSKYNYMYKSTILSTVEILLLYHTLIQVCILNIITHFYIFIS